MIPPREQIEHLYDKRELGHLDRIREGLYNVAEAKRPAAGRAALRQLWQDEDELIQKTHWITTKNVGEVKLFTWNFMQKRLYATMKEQRARKRPIRIIILKARQLGASTWMQSWQWEQCDREPNRNSLTVSFDDQSVIELFQKVQVIRRNLWFSPPMTRDQNGLLEIKGTNSTFHLRTAGNKSAGRSQTIHNLHCSECAMWEQADEVLTGLLQAVPSRAGTSIVFESTAQGAVGAFYEAWRAAERGESDYAAFFAPWYWDPEYRLDFADATLRDAFGRTLTPEERQLGDTHRLDLEQLAWRRWKIRNDCQGSTPKFQQEFPATAREAFLSTGSQYFDQHAIERMERGCKPPLWTGEVALQR